VLDRFMDYRSRTGSCSDDAFRRLLARAWNANVGTIPGWPVRTLTVPLAKPAVEQEWEDFPAGLRWDVDQSPGPDQGPSEPDWTTHPALKTVHD
jgi:hypothetical protein